jgi:hypothetical protein
MLVGPLGVVFIMSMFIEKADYFSAQVSLDVEALGWKLDHDIKYRSTIMLILGWLSGRGRDELYRQIRCDQTAAITKLLGSFNCPIYSVQTYKGKEVTLAAMIVRYSIKFHKREKFPSFQTWWFYKVDESESSIHFRNLVEFFEHELYDAELDQSL